jgi:hypothetical protein
MERLSLRSDASMKFSFGSLLLPLLSSEMVFGLSVLDLTNQAIGERGLDLLRKVLERGALTELYFDGSSVHSVDILSKFCEAVIASRLRFAEFPALDFEKLLRVRISEADDQELTERREQLYRQFTARFDPSVEIDRSKPIAPPKPKPSQPTKLTAIGQTRKRSSTDVDATLPEGLQDALKINPEIASLYNECVAGEPEQEPLIEHMRTMQEELSPEALIEAIS